MNDKSKSMRKHAKSRIESEKLTPKEKELYDLAFWLFNKGYGREYLRQLVTVACIDAFEKEKKARIA